MCHAKVLVSKGKCIASKLGLRKTMWSCKGNESKHCLKLIAAVGQEMEQEVHPALLLILRDGLWAYSLLSHTGTHV